MRTKRCENPGCTLDADYKVVIVHHIEMDDYQYRYLCAQHYAAEKQRSHRYEYNISEVIPNGGDDEQI